MTSLGFIGTGKMASAIIRGVCSAGLFSKENIIASNIHATSREKASKELGIKVVEKAEDVVNVSDIIVLAVKPNQIGAVFDHGDLGIGQGKILISIAAGVTIDTLKSYVPDAKIVRVMPNICSTVSASATGYCLSSGFTNEEIQNVKNILNAIGTSYEFKEKDMDAVSSIVGCAPAFVFMAIEALADGGVLMGIPRDKAIGLAAQTVLGSAKTVLESGIHPAMLKDNVCSPGGSTIEGVKVLEEYAFRSALTEAVKACTEKNRELGKQ